MKFNSREDLETIWYDNYFVLKERDLKILRGGHPHEVVTYTVDYQSPDGRTPVHVYGVVKDRVTDQKTLATFCDIEPKDIILDKTILVPVVRRGIDRARGRQQSGSRKGKEGDPSIDRTYRLAFRPPIGTE